MKKRVGMEAVLIEFLSFTFTHTVAILPLFVHLSYHEEQTSCLHHSITWSNHWRHVFLDYKFI